MSIVGHYACVQSHHGHDRPDSDLRIHLDLSSHNILTLAFMVSEKSNCCYLASNIMKGKLNIYCDKMYFSFCSCK